ncbi:MAG: M24 family metallopeptidase [Pseudoclavibacter sp.]
MDTAVRASTLAQPSRDITSITERDQRWDALTEAARAEGYDVLLFAAADYRGHKGSVRYLSGYNLPHRYGYAVMYPGEEPTVVLPKNLELSRRPHNGWISEYRMPNNLGQGLVEALSEKGTTPHIGIIGMKQVLKVEDYLAITQGLPGAKISDADDMFSRVRAVKSPAEQLAVRESSVILDHCFDRLLEIARPGMTEHQVAAEMYRVAADLGGEDPLFLTMYTEIAPDGSARGTFGQPGGRILGVNDVFTFSFEVVGPNGYWTELSRMVTFASPTSAVTQIADAVTSGIEAAAAALTPGTAFGEVQRRVIEAVEAKGARSEYWSGHGMGLDVLEEPWVGLDVAQDSSHAGAVPETQNGHVLALHPQLWDDEANIMAYMSDSFIVVDGAAERLSKHELRLHQLS